MTPLIRPPRLGLALGGGGVRGLAHIGILHVLEREGIRPAVMAGTSMGGLVAAAYAAGLSPQALTDEVSGFTHLRRLLTLVDLAPARRGLLQGERIRSMLIDKLGKDTTFADLPFPLGLVAVDIDTGEEVVLTRGSLVDAVLATCAVPGIFPPVRYGERFLSDGGILNNVPADVARRLGAEVVIAVDVGPEFGARFDSAAGRASKDGANLRRGQAPGFLPPVARDLYQSYLIMAHAATQERLRHAHPDLVLRPDIPADITAFSGFMRALEPIRAGERAAKSQMAMIRESVKPGLRLF
jgi:NTE family protein